MQRKKNIEAVFVYAMQEEAAPMIQELESSRSLVLDHFSGYRGKLGDGDVLVVVSGIGLVPASHASTLVLEGFRPRVIVNAGTSGAVDDSLSVGDNVYAVRAVYTDADASSFGYLPGQLPQSPAFFASPDHLVSMLQKYNKTTGTVGSGNSFVSSAAGLGSLMNVYEDLRIVDMESTAVAQVASFYGVPWVSLRAVSDIISSPADNAEQFNQNLAAATYSNTVEVLSFYENLDNYLRR